MIIMMMIRLYIKLCKLLSTWATDESLDRFPILYNVNFDLWGLESSCLNSKCTYWDKRTGPNVEPCY